MSRSVFVVFVLLVVAGLVSGVHTALIPLGDSGWG